MANGHLKWLHTVHRYAALATNKVKIISTFERLLFYFLLFSFDRSKLNFVHHYVAIYGFGPSKEIKNKKVKKSLVVTCWPAVTAERFLKGMTLRVHRWTGHNTAQALNNWPVIYFFYSFLTGHIYERKRCLQLPNISFSFLYIGLVH